MTASALVPLKGFKFGCDPELFVANSDGEFVSAEGLIPGTKNEPHPVDGGAVQVDGMAAEFNIDPARTFEEFDNNITKVLETLKKMLPEGYSLHALPSVDFSEEVWEKTPYMAKVLGCSPDFNAWTGEVNPPPENREQPRLRTAAGHLHIGWTEDMSLSNIQHIMNCRDLVKQLDWYLGAWSVLVDKDTSRRSLYGKAGACRYKPYGVEYRVLSNFWVLDPVMRLETWNRMVSAIQGMRSGYMPKLAQSIRTNWNDKLIQSISESSLDSKLATKFTFPIFDFQ